MLHFVRRASPQYVFVRRASSQYVQRRSASDQVADSLFAESLAAREKPLPAEGAK